MKIRPVGAELFHTDRQTDDEANKFNIHGSVHRSNLVVITNKMQLGEGIYHSSVYYKLNMFRAVCRSSSGAPTVFASSGLHTHAVTARSQV